MPLYKNTVSDLLWNALVQLMSEEELQSFRLVGGTALSLQCGHRMSIDIDLFTDRTYGSVDFDQIDWLIAKRFTIAQMSEQGNQSMGKSYYVGSEENNLVKLDFYYTDTFIYPELSTEKIRMATKEEIAAMKLEVIGRGGRKKDFWDVHELLDSMSIHDMLSYYEKRYPYGHTKENLIQSLTKFDSADDDFDPECLRQKHWELIKLDFKELIDKEFPSMF
ncbi:MAG: nucleotidyl transferase AbiEii/AbiGii toxin family protein [Flavobacteriales bacterium]